MSEDRRAAPAPSEALATSADADVDVDVVEEPRPADDSAPQAAPDAPPVTRLPQRESSPGVRKRGRMTLRIPDDEVARPTGATLEVTPVPRPVAEAAAPVESLPALVPSRIISISEPPPELPPPPAPPPPTDDADEVTPPPVPVQPHDVPAPVPALADAADDEVELTPVPEPVQKPAEPVVEARIASPVAVAIEPLVIEDEPTQPFLPQAPSTPSGVAVELDSEEIKFEDDALTPSLPRVDALEIPDRMSDPGDAPEVSVEDVMAVEAAPAPRPVVDLPPMRSRAPSQPPAMPPGAKSAVPRPPLVIVPPHVGNVQPQLADAAGPRRKGRLWWEDLFNDDYLRTMEKLTDRQIAREADFIEESLGIERGGAVLDLACGTGRQAIELARRGYEVVGFDLSLSMLARAGDEAQGRSAKLNFVQGDMREMTFDEQFDGVYSWNTAFGYFDEEKNAHVVDRVRHALKAGGLFLLDVVNRDFIMRQSPSLAWFEGDGCVCMDEMNVDAITSRMRVKRTLMLDDGRSREIEYSMRVYSLHELGKILHDHGFKVCEVSGRIATPGVFFGSESPRTIILAEKK